MNTRKLNNKQIDTLITAFRFRYVTTKNLARQRNISHNSAYSALETLHNNGYLGKKHQKSYRLLNKSARYYLTPQAVAYLRKSGLGLNEDILNSRLREKSRTSDFIDMQVAIHKAYLDIDDELGGKATIQTGSEMAGQEGVIKPYPSLYVQPTEGRHYFVELADGQHLFLVKKRIRKYIEHYESDEWEWDEYPNVRIVRKSKADQTKLIDYIEEKMDDTYLDEDDFSIEAKRFPIIRHPKLVVE